MKKYPFVFLVIGLILLGVGFQMPPSLYWTSIVLCGLGGFITGFSLSHINKEKEE